MNILITGASSGIGKALALQFAKCQHNVVLVARNVEALNEVANDCKKNSIKALVIPADLSRAESANEIYNELKNKNWNIDILVNNAGFGLHGAFLDTDLNKELEMAHVQVDTTLKLTKLFLPAMIARKHGKILNVGSVYSYAPVPYQSVYGALKTFLLSFSESLAFELRGSGVTVTIVCPGSTRTEFRKRAGAGVSRGMAPEKVAEISYKALMAGRFSIVPGPVNRLFTWAMSILPHSLRARFMQFINGRRGLPHAPTL
jgi:short-subunit dehydrogenase